MAASDLTGQSSQMAGDMEAGLSQAISALQQAASSLQGFGGGQVSRGIPTPAQLANGTPLSRGVPGRKAELGSMFDYTQQYNLKETWQRSMSNALLVYGKEAKAMMKKMTAEQKQDYLLAMRDEINKTEREMNGIIKTSFQFLTQMDRKHRAEVVRHMGTQIKQAMQLSVIQPITGFFKGLISAPFKILGAPLKLLSAIKKQVIGPIFGFFGKMWSENLAPYGRMAKDAWGFALELFTKIQKFIETNIIGAIYSKFQELKRLFESIPGADVALRDYRAIESQMVRAQQQYGTTISQSREFMNIIYQLSNGTISVQQNIDAMNAAMQRGVRGREQVAEYTEDIALWAQALGEGTDTVADLMTTLRLRMGQTRDEANNTFRSISLFVGAMAEMPGGYGTSVDAITQLLQQNEARARLLNLSADAYARTAMVTAQLATASGTNPSDLMNFIMSAGSSDSPLLMNLVGDPHAIQQMIQAGQVDQVWTAILDRWGGLVREVGADEANLQFLEALTEAGISLPPETLNLLLAQADNIAVYGTEAAAALNAEGDAMAYATEEAASNQTQMEAWTKEFESIANSVDFGGIRLGEVMNMLDEFSQRIEAVKAGFDLIGGGMDLIFGPFSTFIKPLATLVGLVVAVGGATVEMSAEVREAMGPFAGFFDLSRGMGDMFQAEILPFLRNVWQGIINFFTKPSGISGPNANKSMFQILIDQGVQWLRDNIPAIMDQMVTVARTISEALADAFDRLEATGFVESMAQFIEDMISAAIPLIDIATDTLVTMVGRFIDLVAGVFAETDLDDKLITLFTTLVDAIGRIATGIGGPLVTLAGSLLYVLQPVFEDLAGIMWDALVSFMPDKLRGFFGIETRAEADQSRLQRVGGDVREDLRIGGAVAAETLLESYVPGYGLASAVFPGLSPTHNAMEAYEAEDLARQREQWSSYLGGVLPQVAEGSITPQQAYSGVAQLSRLIAGTPGAETEAGLAQSVLRELRPQITSLRTRDLLPSSSMFAQATGQQWTTTGAYGEDRGDHPHWGVDLDVVGQHAPGTMVPAILGGVVSYKGNDPGGYGNFVDVLSNDPLTPDSLVTLRYGHLADFAEGVDSESSVSAGDPLGLLGSTGRSTGPHVHLEALDSAGARMDSTPYAMLANGALVMDEMLARVGEAGPEVVAPLPDLVAVAQAQEEKQRELINTIREETTRVVLALMSVKDSLSATSSERVVDMIMGGSL